MEPVELVTSKAFSQDELITVMLQMGVKPDQNPHRMWDYVLRRGMAIVWIDPDDPEQYSNSEVDALIENKLGDPPQTRIVLHISRNQGSEQLALELVTQFARQWPCVLDNLRGRGRSIWTVEEIQAWYKSGRGLWDLPEGTAPPKEWYATDEEYLTPSELEEIEKENREFLE